MSKLWDLEEEKLSKDLAAVASLYNQTSTKKNKVKGALTAYGGNLQRISLHKQLKSDAEQGMTVKRGHRGPQEIRILLSASKAGMHFGNDADGHLYVTKVLVGSAAFDMGVKAEDRIIAVNGMVTPFDIDQLADCSST